MNFKTYMVIVLILLLGYLGYQKYFPKLQKWGDKNAEKLIYEGNSLADMGYWNNAVQKYNLAILLGGKRNDAWAYNCRGIIHWRRYKYSAKNEINFNKALADYNKAEELSDSCYAAMLCNKGLLYASKGDEEKSIRFFDEALKCDPRSHKIYEEKTSALFDLGKYNDSIKFGKEALQKIGESDNIYFNIAYSYEMLGDYKKATEYYDKVLTFSHYRNWAAFTNSSYCKLMLKDYKGATEYAQASIKLYQNNIHPYNFIAFAALETGNTELATEYTNHAFSLYEQPNYLSYYNFARIKYLQGDIEGAKLRLSKARKLFAIDNQTWKFDGFEYLCDQLEAKF